MVLGNNTENIFENQVNIKCFINTFNTKEAGRSLSFLDEISLLQEKNIYLGDYRMTWHKEGFN